jgi:hypothetical protein
MKRRINKTDFILIATKTYISEIIVDKSYVLYIDYNKYFPTGEEFVYADEGSMVTTLCFKYTKMKIKKLNKIIKVINTELNSITIDKEYSVFLITNTINYKRKKHILNNQGLYVILNCVEFVLI